MKQYNVYEVLDSEVTDDRGIKSRLQFQSGPFNTAQEAAKEAQRLRNIYQGFYDFKILEKGGDEVAT